MTATSNKAAAVAAKVARKGTRRAANPTGSTTAPTRAMLVRLLWNRTRRVLTSEILARRMQWRKPRRTSDTPGPRIARQDEGMRHTARIPAGLGILVAGCVLAA